MKRSLIYHHIRPLATQLSDEMFNILHVFHVLTECDSTNPFYRRSIIQSFEKMLLKPELTAFIQSFNTPNPKILEVIVLFIL